MNEEPQIPEEHGENLIPLVALSILVVVLGLLFLVAKVLRLC